MSEKKTDLPPDKKILEMIDSGFSPSNLGSLWHVDPRRIYEVLKRHARKVPLPGHAFRKTIDSAAERAKAVKRWRAKQT